MNTIVKKSKTQTTKPSKSFEEQPPYKVPIEEQDTLIQFGRKDKNVNIFTNDPTVITKINKNHSVIENYDKEISRIKSYAMPKDFLTFRSKDRGKFGKNSSINQLSSSVNEKTKGKPLITLPEGKVPIEEQETTIQFYRDMEIASIYTSDPTMMTKLDKIYQAVKVDICHGTVCAKWYEIPKRWICFCRKKREMMKRQEPIFVSVPRLEGRNGT